MFLLFDEDNVVHRPNTDKTYVFTTQGHIFHLPHHLRYIDDDDASSILIRNHRAAPDRLVTTCHAIPWQYYFYEHYHAARNRSVARVVHGAPRVVEQAPTFMSRVVQAVRDMIVYP